MDLKTPPEHKKKKMFWSKIHKHAKNSISYDKILYKASFWPSGTCFWSFRSIENGFPIQMVQFWWILELGNDVSWRNNVWHKFFLYKACFGPYGTWFWSSRSIENKILILFILFTYWYLKINDVSWPDNMYVVISIYGYPYGYPYMDIHIWISIYGY